MRTPWPWLLGAALVAACDGPTPPTPLSDPADPAFSQAGVTQVFRVDDEFTIIDACSGEALLVESHEQVVTFFKGTDEHGHLRLHVSEVGSTLTHLSTGVVETLHGASNLSANGDFTSDTSPGEFNFVVNQSFTRVGAPAGHFRQMFHVTVNANGVLAVEHSVEPAPCA